MTAISDLSDLINRLSGGNSGTPENLFFHKVARVAGAAAPATIAGRPCSLWLYDGQPSAGTAPGAVAIPTNATTGGLMQADPGGGRQKWLIQGWATGLVGGTLVLYDRLLHQSNLSGTVTTAQTVGSAITRYTDGNGNCAWIEIYTQIGATTTSVTMSYVDQDDANSTSPAVVIGNTGFREQTRIIMLPLASGDTRLKNVNSITVAATTGTAGAMGVTIAHPLCYLPIGAAAAPAWRDFSTGMPGIPEIATDACLALAWYPQTTTAPEIIGGISCVEA